MTSEPAELEALAERIRTAFPDLAFAKAELNEYGDDNRVVVLDEAWIVRFPRNEEYLARFAAELHLLTALAPVSPLPVPRYAHIAGDGSFGAYRMIAGVNLTPAVFDALQPSDRTAVIDSLASFLSVLHAMPPETIMQSDGSIPQTWSGEQFAALYRGMRRARIARVVPPAMLERFDAFHETFEKLAPGGPRLVHDDLSEDHILIAGNRIAGIIDFSDASFGDPAIDFAWFWRLGERAVDSLLRGYRFASADRSLKTRSHWMFVRYLINQLWYGERAKWGLRVEQVLEELDPHLGRLGF